MNQKVKVEMPGGFPGDSPQHRNDDGDDDEGSFHSTRTISTPLSRYFEAIKEELGQKQALLSCLPVEETDSADLDYLHAQILSLQEELERLAMEQQNDPNFTEIVSNLIPNGHTSSTNTPATPGFSTPQIDTNRKRGFSQVDHSPYDDRALEERRRLAPPPPPSLPVSYYTQRPPFGYEPAESSRQGALGLNMAENELIGSSKILGHQRQIALDEQIARAYEAGQVVDLTASDDEDVLIQNIQRYAPRVKWEPRNSSYTSFGGPAPKAEPTSFALKTEPQIIDLADDEDDDIVELPGPFSQPGFPQMHSRGVFYHSNYESYESDSGDDHEKVSKLLEHLADDAENSGPNDRLQTPKELNIKLMEHQKIGLTWLVKQEESSNKGGILADDMGLGKTIQALSLILHRKSTRPHHKTTLIICPVALMAQWQREIELKVKNQYALSTYVFHGQQNKKFKDFNILKEFDVVLTSYGTIAGEYKKLESWRKQKRVQFPTTEFPFFSNQSSWYRIILDESQHVKNYRTLTSRACSELMATYRLCLSGTPMQNSIDDLFGSVRFLHLDRYREFKDWNVDFGSKFKLGREFATSAMSRLQTLLTAIMLRRKKDSLIDGKPLLTLPDKVIELVHPIFSEDEQELYSAVEQKIAVRFNRYLEEGAVSRNYTYMLLLLLRLRQFCCHPKMIKDLSMKLTPEERNKQVELMNELSAETIERLKGEEIANCPICMETDPRIKIVLPCGHYYCQECLSSMSTHAQHRAMADGDERHQLTCPQCRGPMNPERVIDLQIFQSVHMDQNGDLSNLDSQLRDALGDDLASDSDDSDSGSDGDSSDAGSDLANFIVKDEEVESSAEDDEDSENELTGLGVSSSLFSPVAPRRIKRETRSTFDGQFKKEEEIDNENITFSRSYRPRGENKSRRAIIDDTDDERDEGEDLPSDIFNTVKKETKCESEDEFKFQEDKKATPTTEKVAVNVKGKRPMFEGTRKPSKKKDLGKRKGKGKGKGRGKGPSNKMTLSNKRTEAMRNRKARKKYFRELARNWTTSAKIEKVREILKEIQEKEPAEKTIVFSSFTSFLDLLQIPLQQQDKIEFERYDGSMNAKERNDAVLRFTEDPHIKLMLVSLKAGNSGLNLTAASNVIIIEPWWNPYVEEQAIDRAHRIGQTRVVNVHRLIIENTVEDRILTLQEQKREVISAAMDEEARKNISRLSMRDMVYLFTGNRG
ncbi:hypothetical protein TWF694_009731 [Orbilia ellipsospora]|uniref:Uncharacterized protein n=1 Tax=Orbilia ellipsospora TaxID=2528407 RepID=A0AAV9XET5_9PEZI